MKLGTYITHKSKNGKWWFEYSLFSKFEGAALHIDFNFPTPSDKSFVFGFALFTCILFYVEIAYLE